MHSQTYNSICITDTKLLLRFSNNYLIIGVFYTYVFFSCQEFVWALTSLTAMGQIAVIFLQLKISTTNIETRSVHEKHFLNLPKLAQAVKCSHIYII